jgi:hypothetical protein
MTVLLLLPAALSLLALGAHFLRGGHPLLVLATLALLALLFVPRRWAARTVQAGLGIGALEWVRALVVLLGERRSEGLPYARLVVILGVVAAVCAASALAFRAPPVRRRFGTAAVPAAPTPERSED